MDTIMRNVKDIEAKDRQGLEHVIGQQLQDNQQIFIKVMTVAAEDDLADTYAAQMESAMRAGWDDPAMDDYNEYDKHRPRLVKILEQTLWPTIPSTASLGKSRFSVEIDTSLRQRW